jgi:predicted glycosyltransferase
MIAYWTKENFEFPGYICGFDPAAFADREALRADLGYRPDEKVCIVSAGGSGVGDSLLRRVIEAHPEAKAKVPSSRAFGPAPDAGDPR